MAVESLAAGVRETFPRALPQTPNGVDGGDTPRLLFTVSGPGGIEPFEARRRTEVHNPGPVHARALRLLPIIR